MGIEGEWCIPTSDVSEIGLHGERRATAAQCAELAAKLGLLDCTKLHAGYRAHRLQQGRYRVTAQIDAHVVQACVVTLEPVDSDLTLSINVEFWPPDHIEAHDADASSAGAEVDDQNAWVEVSQTDAPEPIVHGRIDLGRLVFEEVSAGLDPYPRRADAAFNWKDPRDTGDTPHPFAGLIRLKPKN